MPSKLTTILAVGGLALITANEGSGLYSLVNKHAMGLVVDAENQAALNAGLRMALTGDETVKAANARRYAEQYLSLGNVMNAFVVDVVQH